MMTAPTLPSPQRIKEWLSTASDEDAAKLRSLLIERKKYENEHKREFAWDWYPWQRDYFRDSLHHTDTVLLAGNQVGKSQCAAYEDALDLTGDYPDDWEGFRFESPIVLWLFGVNAEQTRDVLQKQLFGELREDGTFTGGWVHPDEIVGVIRSQSMKGLATEIRVKHRFGVSICSLKQYTQTDTGRDSLPIAGSVVDKVRCDEQAPDAILGQLHVRIINGNKGRGGKIKHTLTPELGETELIVQALGDDRPPSMGVIGPISWAEAPHLSQEQQDSILAGVPRHEHEMRRTGVPYFAGGRVWPISEDRIKCDPFEIGSRPWYRCIKALDIGVDHPSALAWLAYDPDSDCIYVTKVWRMNLTDMQDKYGEDVNPSMVIATTVNSQWRGAPLVVPHDIDQTEKGTGRTVRKSYQNAGVGKMIDFSNPTARAKGQKKAPRCNKVEPGIMAMYDRMTSDRFKVFSTCGEFFDEFRSYHRKGGKIVALRDDVISAVRYGSQMVATHGMALTDDRRQTKAKGTVR